MWLALKLLASGALQKLLKGLSAALDWLLSDWRHPIIVTLAVFGAWHHFVINPRMQALLDESAALVEATQLAHIQTIADFFDASEQAEREAEANAARVKAQQETITNATLADLRADHSALRARFDRLRARGGAAIDPGHADAAGLPGPGDAAGGTAAAAPDHDLRPARERQPGELTAQPACPAGLVCLTIDEAEQASEDAHRHNRLIDWVIAQSALRFVPGQEPR